MNIERHKEIFEYISRNGFATPDELAGCFNISAVTIRRDLINMEREQLIKKVHGGATLATSAVFSVPFQLRVRQNAESKKAIAKYAVSLIKRGETIFLDAGSTCYYLAEILPEHMNLRVITHSCENVSVLKAKQGIEVICSGGELDRSICAYVGPITERFLREFYADKSFLAAAYINIEQGCINNKITETTIKRLIYEQAKERFLLVDSSKFGVHGFHCSIGIDEFKGTIITDKGLSKEQKTLFSKKGISLITV